MNDILQFGTPHGTYTDRPGAYAVILHDGHQLLVVTVQGRFHLPGGGIDKDETPEAAVVREVREETGYHVLSIQKIGEANQFLETTSLGPLNKLGTFFKVQIDIARQIASQENDHHLQWIDLETFLSSSASEYQKWAVKRSLEQTHR